MCSATRASTRAAHARDAHTLLAALPPSPERETALSHARLIVNFHEQSVAGKGGFGSDERPSADRIIDWQEATDTKVVYWDGIAHTTALALRMGGTDFVGAGSYLRKHFGDGYVPVAIGFHHGDLGLVVAPDPAPGLVDAALAAVDLPAFVIDLHADAPDPVARWLQEPVKARVISGIYDPTKDAKTFIALDSLIDAFDILIHVHEATPVQWLPEFTVP